MPPVNCSAVSIRRPTAGALRLAATAAAGVLAGHFVGYRLVFPGSPQRHAILIETGHGYLPAAARIAAMLVVVAGAALLARGYEHARSGGWELPSRHATATRLAIMQVSAFVGLEFLERIVSGVPMHHFLLPVLAVGAVAQIAIAFAGAALIEALYRVGRRLARLGAPASAVAEPHSGRREGSDPFVRLLDGRPTPIRGPPELLLATR